MYKDQVIIPGKSAAGITLGNSRSDVEDVLGTPEDEDTKYSGWTISTYPSVKVWFDKDNRVKQIGLYEGYTGQTEDGVKLGMTKENLKEIWGLDLAYNKDDEYWSFMSKENVLFDFENGRISAIYICKEIKFEKY